VPPCINDAKEAQYLFWRHHHAISGVAVAIYLNEHDVFVIDPFHDSLR